MQLDEKSISVIRIKTEVTSKHIRYGCVDVTRNWMNNAVPNSHKLKIAKAIILNGKLYVVDGRNVKLEYSCHEEDIAELIEETFGGELYLLPKIQGKYKGVQTADYLFRGEKYDLKDIRKQNADAVFNAIHGKRKQAENFVICFNEDEIDKSEILRQCEGIFQRPYVSFVKRLIMVSKRKVIRIYERKK